MNTKRHADESVQLGPDQAKKAKAEELEHTKGGLADIIEKCTTILKQLQDDPECMDNWMVALAVKALQYGKKENLEGRIAEKKEEQVSYLRNLTSKMCKEEFGSYIRNVESLARKNSEKDKHLDQALQEQARCIMVMEKAQEEATTLKIEMEAMKNELTKLKTNGDAVASRIDTTSPQYLNTYAGRVAKSPPKPTPTPAPKPTIINEPIMKWAEEIRSTRIPVETDCHLIWGENPTLEHPEKLKEILVEIAMKTCKCTNKETCECYKKAVAVKSKQVKGHKPAVILITTRSIELRNMVQKTLIKDYSCGVLELRNRRWREELPSNFPTAKPEEEEKYIKVFIKQVPENLAEADIRTQLKDVLPEIKQGQRICRRDETPTSTIWLTFQDTADNRKTVEKVIKEKGVFVNRFRRPVELEKKSNIVQCRKCQVIGHTQRNCKNRSANCRICAKDHQTQDHIRVPYEKYKCYNCGLDHQANSWRCKKIAEAERKTIQTSATNRQTDNTRKKTTNNKPSETQQRTTSNSEKKCYSCNVVGHIARFCTNKKQEKTDNVNSVHKNRGGAKRREHNNATQENHADMMNRMLDIFMEALPKEYCRTQWLQRRLGEEGTGNSRNSNSRTGL